MAMCDSAQMSYRQPRQNGSNSMTASQPHLQESRMNTMTWIGIIIWGMIITGIGLATAGTPAGIEPDLQPHDVVFLVTGGVLTVLIGISGLMGIMGWVPGVRKDHKTTA
jgi:hypothetical protein